MSFRPVVRRSLWFLLILFAGANVITFFHAWNFTHFSNEGKFVKPEEMSASAKLGMLVTGLSNPRSQNSTLPEIPYQQITLSMPDGRILDAWNIPADSSKGTVMLFHGFRGYKSSMLAQAEFLHARGYNTFLIDFTGHGNSQGNHCTLGYHEAEEVAFAFEHAKQLYPGQPVVMLGSSMGAVAIIRAVGVLGIQPDRLVLEAPFGTMEQAVKNRFTMTNIPSFPMAEMMVFWGGAQQGFSGFSFNPQDYAANITVPTLLLYGQYDEKVTMPETERIYAGLKGEKHLHVFQQSGHCSFIDTQPEEWSAVVDSFLNGPAM